MATGCPKSSLSSLRENIALVSQDVVLFNDTIAANIAYGAKRDASPEAIRVAATRRACAGIRRFAAGWL